MRRAEVEKSLSWGGRQRRAASRGGDTDRGEGSDGGEHGGEERRALLRDPPLRATRPGASLG